MEKAIVAIKTLDKVSFFEARKIYRARNAPQYQTSFSAVEFPKLPPPRQIPTTSNFVPLKTVPRVAVPIEIRPKEGIDPLTKKTGTAPVPAAKAAVRAQPEKFSKKTPPAKPVKKASEPRPGAKGAPARARALAPPGSSQREFVTVGKAPDFSTLQNACLRD